MQAEPWRRRRGSEDETMNEYDRDHDRNHDAEEPLVEGLDEMALEGFDLPPADPAVQEAIFARTASVVRWRRTRRRAVLAAGWLITFGLGFLAARLGDAGVTSPTDATGPTFAQPNDPVRDDGAVREGPIVAEATPTTEEDNDPVELELRSDDLDDASRRDLLRRAGDEYLSERGDVESAMRCYRKLLAIDEAGDDRVSLEPEDSWLLVAMKSGRL